MLLALTIDLPEKTRKLSEVKLTGLVVISARGA